MPDKYLTVVRRVQIRHPLRNSDTYETVGRRLNGGRSKVDGSVLEQLSYCRLHDARGEGVILKRTHGEGASASIWASEIRAKLEEVALAGVQDAECTNGEWLSTSSTKLAVDHEYLMNRDIWGGGSQFVDV